MTDNEIISYLGNPWLEGATGPHEFDCWGLLRYIMRHHYGKIVEQIPLGNPAAILDVVQGKLTYGEWVQLDEPKDGCGALLRGGSEPHVGVWLQNDGGGVLHSIKGSGVVYSNKRDLKVLMFPRVKYYDKVK